MHTLKNLRWFNILILLALALSPLSAAAPSQASEPLVTPDLEFDTGYLLARLQDGFTLEGDTLPAPGVLSAQPLFRGIDPPAGLQHVVRLELLPGSDVRAMAESLSGDPRFAWVEPDYLATGSLFPSPFSAKMGRGLGWGGLDAAPNDPLFPDQWGLSKIEAPAAWDVQTGSETVVIAIVDSGIERTHPDLQGRLWVNPGEVAGNGLDDDNNGFIDDVHGWDFVSEDNDPLDDNGHGTQVAGGATAATNNNTGIAGTCWNCRLMAVKVMSAGGVANYSDIAQGVLYAAQKGAKVINLSLGGYSFSNALLEAVQSAVNDYGAVVVAGAGNDNTDAPFYPAAYEEAIAVAGTDQNDLKASFSDFGDWVDLSAPAVAIYTTFSGGDYGPVDGTSMAAPFVSGLAGLLFSEHPGWSNALIRAQLTHTPDPLDALNPGYEGLLGSGRLNAGSALTVTPHPLLSISGMLVNGDPLGRPDPGESSTLELTLANDWLDAESVQGDLSTNDPYVTITQDSAGFGDLPAGGSGTGTPAYTFDVSTGAGYDHLINFTLQLSAYGGYSTTLDFTIKTRSAEEQVWGTIGEDTTWTNDKTYIVMGNIGVAPGITLTIEAGTDVKFNGDYSLNVGGQLIADGTVDQPIRFLSNTGDPWSRIYFDDTSIDATADLSGTYQSGNLLRWVVMEGASEGIDCNNATPYLSHLTTDQGGVNCITGGTPFWFVNSSLQGDIIISDDAEGPGKWSTKASMPTARYCFGVATASNGRIYAIGGWDGSSQVLNTVEEYNPQTDTWTTKASMPTTRMCLAVVAASNGKIYAIGGQDQIGDLNTVEEYDPITDHWTTRASMSIPRRSHAAAAASNGKIYVIGGISNMSIVASVEEYDPLTDTWLSRMSMPTKRSSLAAAEANNGKVYAIGGLYSGALDIVEEYDPLTNSWTSRSNMPSPRSGLGATTGNDGIIYAIGGDYIGFLDTVEAYDPVMDSWLGLDAMPTERTSLGVTAIPNGKIYAIGGINDVSTLNIVEVYNPVPKAPNTHIMYVDVIGGGMSLPAHSEIKNSIVEDSITINGHGMVVDSSVSNSIMIDSGQVLSNTLQGGGITAGDGSLVQGNNIEGSSTWAIQTSGTITITQNRLVGNVAGIQASGGTIQGNLVANSTGVGLEINGDVSVSNNTFTGNTGNTIVINSGTPIIQDNNLEGNTGAYDIENLTTNDIQASNNWWGTTEPYPISLRIYDYDDDYNLGEVVYQPVADGPIQNAPAYVRSVTVEPNPVGIETATFEVEFSRPMDMEMLPKLEFQSVLNNTWTVYNNSNSGLPNDFVLAMIVDPDGSLWFGTDGGAAHFDGTSWTVYDSSNSGLPHDRVYAIATSPDGSHWFGTGGGGVAHFDGMNWSVFNPNNSGLPSDIVYSVNVDQNGSLWFGTAFGAALFDGQNWTVYDSSNSGLPNYAIWKITNDIDGLVWFGTLGGGAAHFDGITWDVFNTTNSGLPYDYVPEIFVDPDGSHWFGTDGGGMAHYYDGAWKVYNTSNSELLSDYVLAITRDPDDSYWFGTWGGGVLHMTGEEGSVYTTSNSGLPYDYVRKVVRDASGAYWFGTGSGLGVLWQYNTYPVQDNPLWLDDTHFQSTFDITSLIPRGDYRITVAGAFGTDGLQIAPNTATTFTVDYAGGVGDTTAPGLPYVTACAGATLDSLSASWSASDPDSEITLYQYAIGTTLGGTDVINWTVTSETSFDLNGLTLIPGQLYYISVKARNAGGLWSEAATPDGVLPGSGVCTTNSFLAYLSLVSK